MLTLLLGVFLIFGSFNIWIFGFVVRYNSIISAMTTDDTWIWAGTQKEYGELLKKTKEKLDKQERDLRDKLNR